MRQITLRWGYDVVTGRDRRGEGRILSLLGRSEGLLQGDSYPVHLRAPPAGATRARPRGCPPRHGWRWHRFDPAASAAPAGEVGGHRAWGYLLFLADFRRR